MGTRASTKWIPGISWGRGGRPGWAKAQAGKERDTGSSNGVSTTPAVGAGGQMNTQTTDLGGGWMKRQARNRLSVWGVSWDLPLPASQGSSILFTKYSAHIETRTVWLHVKGKGRVSPEWISRCWKLLCLVISPRSLARNPHYLPSQFLGPRETQARSSAAHCPWTGISIGVCKGPENLPH